MSTSVSVESISPQKAKDFLSNNPINRRLNANHVSLLSREMKSGDWQTTGQGITIGCNGELLDGQHRLAAIVSSGVTLQLIVARNVNESARDILDTSIRKRSASDIFTMRGEKNSAVLAGSLGVISSFMRTGHFTTHHSRGISQPDLDRLLERFPETRDWASFICRKPLSQLAPPSVTAGLSVLFDLSNDDVAYAEDFMSLLNTGAHLSPGNPIFTLRSKFIANQTSVHKFKRDTFIAYYIKAWNAYKNGNPMKIVRYAPNDSFPVIDGLPEIIQNNGKTNRAA